MLAPYLEQAMARKQWMAPLTPETTPPVLAWGRRIMDQPEALRKNMDQLLRKATGVGEHGSPKVPPAE